MTNATEPTMPNLTTSRHRVSKVPRSQRTAEARGEVTGKHYPQPLTPAGYPRGVDASASAPARAPGGFPVVGIIGGGQLARMCAGPATELGITLSVLSETADGAAALAVRSAPVGDYTDPETVLAFARGCDVITFDHEHVPAPVLAALAAAGVIMRPAPAALIYAQDKLAMRSRLHDLGIPCPRWTRADTLADVAAFGAEVGWPVVAKVPVGGYDGKGVRVLTTPGEATAWLRRGPVLLEERVDFVRELAVLVARSPSGQAAAWPVVETVQSEGVCSEVHAPAPDLDPQLAAAATAAGLRIAGVLGVTGVLASSTNSRCAPTTVGTGAWMGRSPGSSSSTCGPSWTCRWGTRAPGAA